ncbi:hypothetical protein HAX54_003232, partial [Datura stramonium]|nr:hypothetical protein [Datura stramonium]
MIDRVTYFLRFTGEQPVRPGGTLDEASVEVQGFRPLPHTRISPNEPAANRRLAGLHLRST